MPIASRTGTIVVTTTSGGGTAQPNRFPPSYSQVAFVAPVDRGNGTGASRGDAKSLGTLLAGGTLTPGTRVVCCQGDYTADYTSTVAGSSGGGYVVFEEDPLAHDQAVFTGSNYFTGSYLWFNKLKWRRGGTGWSDATANGVNEAERALRSLNCYGGNCRITNNLFESTYAIIIPRTANGSKILYNTFTASAAPVYQGFAVIYVGNWGESSTPIQDLEIAYNHAPWAAPVTDFTGEARMYWMYSGNGDPSFRPNGIQPGFHIHHNMHEAIHSTMKDRAESWYCKVHGLVEDNYCDIRRGGVTFRHGGDLDSVSFGIARRNRVLCPSAQNGFILNGPRILFSGNYTTGGVVANCGHSAGGLGTNRRNSAWHLRWVNSWAAKLHIGYMNSGGSPAYALDTSVYSGDKIRDVDVYYGDFPTMSANIIEYAANVHPDYPTQKFTGTGSFTKETAIEKSDLQGLVGRDVVASEGVVTAAVYQREGSFIGRTVAGYTIKDSRNRKSIGNITIDVDAASGGTLPPAGPEEAVGTMHLRPLPGCLGSGLRITAVGTVTGGSATLVDNATVKFTATAGFVGTATIAYTITDSAGSTSSDTIRVACVQPAFELPSHLIAGTSLNTAVKMMPHDYSMLPAALTGIVLGTPMAAKTKEISAAQGTSVEFDPTANDSGSGSLRVTEVTEGAKGKAEIVPGSNRVVYAPKFGQSGTDEFEYAVADAGSTARAKVTVTITAVGVGKSVVANDDSRSTNYGVASTFSPIANDVATPAGAPLVILSTGTPSQGGTVTISTDRRSVTHTPKSGFSGTETFTYWVAHASDETVKDQGTVSIEVRADEPSTYWWLRNDWINGRPWCSGPGYDGGNLANFESEVSYSAAITGQVGSHAGSAGTVDEMIGGPVSQGSGSSWSPMSGSQMSWTETFGDSLRYLSGKGRENTAYCYAVMSTCPDSHRTDGSNRTGWWDACVRGTYDTHFSVMGARIKKRMNQFGWDEKYFIARFNHEMNQSNTYQVFSSTRSVYRAAMERISEKMREGFGSRMKICHSPGRNDNIGAFDDWVPQSANGGVDVIGLSLHQVGGSAGSRADALRFLQWSDCGTRTDLYGTKQHVLPACRKLKVPYGNPEWAPSPDRNPTPCADLAMEETWNMFNDIHKEGLMGPEALFRYRTELRDPNAYLGGDTAGKDAWKRALTVYKQRWRGQPVGSVYSPGT
jgi:hypothetical protein